MQNTYQRVKIPLKLNKDFSKTFQPLRHPWVYGKENLGGRKEMCPTFSDCARPVPKKLFVEQINFGVPPPRRQINFGQCTILGVQKIFRTYKRILPDWLCLPNKLAAFWHFGLFNFPLFARLMLNICPSFRQLPPPNPLPPSRTPMTSSLPNFFNYILRYPKQCSKFNVVLSKIQVKQVFRSKKYNQTTMRGHGNAFPCNTIMY